MTEEDTEDTVARLVTQLPTLSGRDFFTFGVVASYLRHDPHLRASKEEVEAFMADQPGWADWKAGDRVGTSRLDLSAIHGAPVGRDGVEQQPRADG